MDYIWELIQWISAIGEVFVCYYILAVLENNGIIKQNKFRIFLGSICIGTVLALNRSGDITIVSWLMILFQSFMIFLTIYKKIKRKRGYLFFLVLACNFCMAIFKLILVLSIVTINPKISVLNVYFKCGIYKSLCCILSLILFCIVCSAVANKKKNKISSLEPFQTVFFWFDTAGMCIVIAIQDQILNYGKYRDKSFLFFIILIVSASIAILFGSMQSATVNTNMEILALKNKILEGNYKEIHNLYQNYAYTYHDMKNYLIILSDLCEKGECENALEYINKIQTPINKVKQFISTGDDVLDLIVNFKLSEAEQRHIEVETIVDITTKIKLEEIDLCSILSNLLDNAIQACNRMIDGHKWIKISIRQQGSICILNMSNSYLEEGTKYKKQDVIHGYGMKSVQEKVDKYQGNMTWEMDGIKSNITIMFTNLKEKDSEG